MEIYLDKKEVKQLNDMVKGAKRSFNSFFLNIQGEAYAGLENTMGDNHYSFVVGPSMSWLFIKLDIITDIVIEFSSFNLQKVVEKSTMFSHLGIENKGSSRIIYGYTKSKDAAKASGVEEVDGYFKVLVGKLRLTVDTQHIYDLCKPAVLDLDQYGIMDDDDIERLMDKQVLIHESNGLAALLGKPMIPGLSRTSNVYTRFSELEGVSDEEKESLFMINLVLEREQIFNYNKYLGVKLH